MRDYDLKKNTTIIFSSIAVGFGGAGDYLGEIKKSYPRSILIAPRLSHYAATKKIKQVLNFLESIFVRILARLIVVMFPNIHAVFHHPQSLGYNTASVVVKFATQVDYWVVDANFFCKKSYNHLDGKECLRCLNEFAPDARCGHFPKKLANNRNYKAFLNVIEQHQTKIIFFVQTEAYKSLLCQKFLEPKVELRKMIVPAFYKVESCAEHDYQFDFCYHGNLLEAKGYTYLLDLARILNSHTFFIPGRFLGDPNDKPTNCIFKNVTWENGLTEHIKVSKIVLCPSLWSAPVEAAVIKSMLSGRPVGLVNNSHSFANEIDSTAYISLSGDAEQDAMTLNKLIDDPELLSSLSKNGLMWAQNYIKTDII